jgi:hypothetical protein
MADVTTDSLEELAFQLSQKRIDKQDRLLDELRSRTGVLLAAAALAASFLGREAFAGHPKAALAIAALGAFLASTGSSLYVLVPKKETFVFSLVGSRVYEELYSLKDDMPEVRRRLAYDLDRFWEANDKELKKITTAYRLGVWALVVEIVVLSAMVSGTIL